VKKFLKESFSNGNRLTNILLSVVTGLLLIIGFLLRDIYTDFKDLVKTSARHETRIEVIETNLTNHINK
jgi:hypothetical protein